MKKNIFLFSTIVVLLDQIVKMVVANALVGHNSIVVIKDFFCLTYVENTGAAWGIFSGSRWFLIIITILIIYAIIKYFLLDEHITKMEFISYILLLGGIVGNLIDRIVRGFIIDYFDFNIWGYNFPVFNIADMAIVIGTVAIVFHLMKNVFRQESKK